jgi:outer membrane protein OmpA-like peptidoglycan-associated protein
MISTNRFRVVGEDASTALVFVLTAFGVVSATGSAWAFDRAASAPLRESRVEAGSAGRDSKVLVQELKVPVHEGPDVRDAGSMQGDGRRAEDESKEPNKPRRCPPLVLNFNSGMATPPHAAIPRLEALAVWLQAHPSVTVVIDGHADSNGWEDGNLHLSRQRAAYTSAVLEKAGVSKVRVQTRGFGSFWPVDEAPPDSSWNRRVVVQTKGESCPREKEEVIEP